MRRLVIYHDFGMLAVAESDDPFCYYDSLRETYSGDEYSNMLLVHEYGHTIQSLFFGSLYLLLVGAPSIMWSFLPVYVKKRDKEYDEGIIDCCKIDPETVLDFHFDMEAVHITTKRDNDEEALRTAKLLNSIYNKSNTGLRVLKCEIRVIQLYGQMNELYKLLTAHRDNPNDKLVMRKLSIVLNRKSAFAAFKRQFIRDNIADYPELEEYLV